jgi:hypothetical protein
MSKNGEKIGGDWTEGRGLDREKEGIKDMVITLIVLESYSKLHFKF